MRDDYEIEDLFRQGRHTVAYRARAKNGVLHMLTKLDLPDDVLTRLGEGRFEEAFTHLLHLSGHGCLRATVDGGLDPVDGTPWLATRHYEGRLLADEIAEGHLSAEDIDRIQFHAESLIYALGPRGGSLCLDPATIITTQSPNAEPVTTFQIDYLQWCTDFAKDREPGSQVDAASKVAHLVAKMKDDKGPLLKRDQESRSPSLRSDLKQAAEIQPIEVKPLASATRGNEFLARLPLILLLLAGIGGGVFWLQKNQQDPKTEEAITATQEPSPKIKKPKKERSNREQMAQKKKAVSTSPTRKPLEKPTPKAVIPPRETRPDLPPKRPAFAGELTDIEAGDLDGLKGSLGQWVVVRGILSIDGEKASFEGSDLSLAKDFELPPRFVGKEAYVTGILKSIKTLEVESLSDLKVILPKKEFYLVSDEEELREMVGKVITVRGTPTSYVQTRSGSSIYLSFHEDRGGFRMGIAAKKAPKGLDQEWLEQFVDQEILVTGIVRQERAAKNPENRNRLVIRFESKDQVRLAK